MLKGTRLHLAAALAAASTVLAAGFLLLPSAVPASTPAGSTTQAPAPKTPSAPAPHPFTLRPDWPVGTRYVYALEWRSEQRMLPPLPGQQEGDGKYMEGSLRLSGDLVLRALGRGKEGFVLGASLENLRQPALSLTEGTADTAFLNAALIGHEALVEVEPSGALRALRFSPEDPDLFKHLMQWLLTHAQPTLPSTEAQRSAGRWEALEYSSLGQAQAVYEVDAARPLTVNRQRTAYARLFVVAGQEARTPQRLESRATFSFDVAGHLSGMRQQERLVAQTEKGVKLVDATELLQLTLREVGRFQPPKDTGLAAHSEVRRPGVIAPSEGLRRKLLEQRTAGLTMEQLVADLLAHGARVPEKERWLWRATGRLELEPERCRELMAVFERPTCDAETRGMVMDLLAAAGHKLAQAVMRELLETRAAREDENAYVMYLQRLGLVGTPEPESLEYLAKQHARAKAGKQEHLRNASAYALGGAVGRMGASDKTAGKYSGLLLKELRGARAAAQRVTYLRALGNVGREENVAAVLSYKADPDAQVRTAVAAALRKTDSPATTSALLQLVRAAEPPVQGEALVALNEHRLDIQALVSLRDMAVSGGLHRGSERLLVSLLAKRLDAGPVVIQMLQLLERAVTDDASLRARIQELLATATRQGGAP